ncbi:hypothetical protein Dcar01_02374 [Deinococcus carri]|uniref:Portal protein n=1 Tax=Deinococcus carri TaxID=1211323 RepID=A0ABP9W8F6_9DEIO
MYHGHHLGKPIGGGAEDLSYWRGPVVHPPQGGTEQEKRQAQAVVNEFQMALRRSFTSTNFIKEFVNREVNSSVARMNWTLLQVEATRDDENKRTTLEQEADALTKAWWRLDRNHPERAIRQALVFARREGRGILRFRVAGGALQQGADGKVRVKPGLKLAQLARYIRLECIAQPENVVVREDPDTFVRSAIYAYQDAAEKEAAEVCTVEGEETVLRVVKEGQEGEAPATRIKLGSRITFIELALDALITPQVLQNQMAYNTASTMILRNTELAGFMERYGINVEPPYVLEQDPDKAEGVMRRRYLPLKVGAGHMTAWRGATYDKTGEKGEYLGEEPLGKPEYGRFTPVSPDALIEAADHNRINLYGEVGQAYVLMGADAVASGRSREVAIADFDSIRQPVIDLAEATITEVLETFLALLAALANQPGRFESIQVDGQVKSRIVPPSPEDRSADRADAQAGVISLQTARQRQGQDDPAQEDAQIERERQAGVSPTLKQQVLTPKAPEATAPPKQTRRKGRKAA